MTETLHRKSNATLPFSPDCRVRGNQGKTRSACAPSRLAVQHAHQRHTVEGGELRAVVFVIWLGGLGGIAMVSQVAGQEAGQRSAAIVDFDRDVRPILSNDCYVCHGPDAAARQADLRLDLREGIYSITEGKAVVEPFHLERSELIQRVLSSDPDYQMPPPKSERRLTKDQLEVLSRWIEQGAAWQAHWSFRKLVRPPLLSLPNGHWAKNAIDLFIQDQLQRVKLEPTKEASRETMIRRLTLDLTGLPPTLDEVAAFRSDLSPNAVERLVDRLLASPHYGERLAIDWLDGARYADTNGYQNDGPRHMWRWRDWVIDAFNRNQPFDQFTIEQIAGDLLPEATLAQKIATGFQRNHRGNAEGGIVPEEFAVEYVVDRVETTAAVWLGLTMGCARCHDHKYDPISQKEFYQLFAFFNNIPEHGRAIKEGNSPPYMLAPTDQDRLELEAIDAKLAEAEDQIARLKPKLAALQTAWEKTQPESMIDDDPSWTPQHDLIVQFDGQQARPVDRYKASFTGQEPTFANGPFNQAIELNGKDYVEIADAGKFGYFDKFSLSAWIFPRKPSSAILSRMVDESQAEGYSLMLEHGHLQLNLVKRWLDDSVRVETESLVPTDRWTHVVAVYDGLRKADGIRFFINGKLQKTHLNLDQLNQSFSTAEPLRIGAGNGPENRFEGLIDEVNVYGRVLELSQIAALSCPDSMAKIASIPPAQRTEQQRSKITSYFIEHVAPKKYLAAFERVQRLQEEKQRTFEALPSVMVMQELAEPRPTHLLSRGQYDQPLEQVSAGVPSCLPALPSDIVRNRLGLARWLVSPDQPLTARVIVNRYWQMLFGVGLVKTSEDFGIQGERPSHSELLDWLAVEFVESGWDVKRLIKMMVMSATYQQSSAGSRESWEKDSENRWLSRGPRFRMSAELIRDQALAASGLLSHPIGGPSSKPYQPDGLWGEIATDVDYVRSTGADLYRRSLYTYWKRTVAPPGMQTFDAPSRETCIVRRTITNTPLQALLMMNEEGMVEAARGLAERTLREAEPELLARLTHAFERTLGRLPSKKEMDVLADCWHAFDERYRRSPDAARLALSLGDAQLDPKWDVVDLATLTAVTSLILNLDEAITKE